MANERLYIYDRYLSEAICVAKTYGSGWLADGGNYFGDFVALFIATRNDVEFSTDLTFETCEVIETMKPAPKVYGFITELAEEWKDTSGHRGELANEVLQNYPDDMERYEAYKNKIR